MALDGSGWPHISYYNWTDGMLEYAYLDAEGWHFESVDASYYGASSSLALDGLGGLTLAIIRPYGRPEARLPRYRQLAS